ncbi:hypothetical protein D9M69_697510 [compost metagenome]
MLYGHGLVGLHERLESFFKIFFTNQLLEHIEYPSTLAIRNAAVGSIFPKRGLGVIVARKILVFIAC